MENENYVCKCGKQFGSEIELISHFSDCEKVYLDLGIFLELSSYIDSITNTNDLKLVKVILKQSVNKLDKKLSFDPVISQNESQANKDFKNNNNNNKKIIDINSFDKEEVKNCSVCLINPIVDYLECLHPICKSCFLKSAELNFSNMNCLICGTEISYFYKNNYLGDNFASFESRSLKKLIKEQIVTCPNSTCKEEISFEKGKPDYNVKNEKGELLSRKAAENYTENRCRCPTCKIDFCVKCKITPFHIGFTCVDFKQFRAAKKCIYDGKVITSLNVGPNDEVCNNPECIETYKMSCKKLLPCGHRCLGIKDENECFPCINIECKEYINLFNQTVDSYCTICYIESLGSSPLVLLSCCHIYHYKCLEKKLKTKWVTPKITFSHCMCSQCNQWLETPYNDDLTNLIRHSMQLYSQIEKQLKERIKLEGIDKDPRLSNPKDPYFNKLFEYGMHKISFYLCSKCDKPYFAGLRECHGGPGDQNNQDANRIFDKKDLICNKCVNFNGCPGVTKCQKHGTEYIDYKCRYCCDIACWFCFGTTHFCDKCHQRAMDIPNNKSLWKMCNPGVCQWKIKHPQPGEEYALGCSLCRYER